MTPKKEKDFYIKPTAEIVTLGKEEPIICASLDYGDETEPGVDPGYGDIDF